MRRRPEVARSNRRGEQPSAHVRGLRRPPHSRAPSLRVRLQLPPLRHFYPRAPSLCCPGWSTVAIHRRDPTTDQHGSFDLLRFRPGPVHPSLGNLVVPRSRRVTILMPNLVRTPDRHSALQPRTPGLKRSSSLSLPSS